MAASTLTAPGLHGARVAEFAALGTAAYWGSTYVVHQRLVGTLTPAAVALMLSLTCALLSAPSMVRAVRDVGGIRPAMQRKGLIACGAVLGLCTGVGYLAQAIGLQYTSTSRAGFIVGMAAIAVLVIEFLLFRKRPSGAVVLGILVAVVGVYLLTNSGTGFSIGDAIMLIAPVAYGGWTVAAHRFAGRYPAAALNGFGFLVAAACSVPLVLVSGLGRFSVSMVALLVALASANVGIFAACVWIAGRVAPARYGLLHLFEPVVAASLGFLLGERIGLSGAVGASLILGALLFVQVAGTDEVVAAPVRFVRSQAEQAAWEKHRHRVRRWASGVVGPGSAEVPDSMVVAPLRRERAMPAPRAPASAQTG